MGKGTEDLINARKKEIVFACEKLYETMNFKDITMKDIAKVTSFTRTSIYNYFQTKEEIFLALLQKEYEAWIVCLRKLRKSCHHMNRTQFAEALAHSLDNRQILLKLMSMNHYDMEENSRAERLIEFKYVYGRALEEVTQCLRHFFSEMKEVEIQDFVFLFFPFLFGVYPYAVVTDKQRAAMEAAGVAYRYSSVYEMISSEAKHLLGV